MGVELTDKKNIPPKKMTENSNLNIKLDFGGGSEYLFGNKTKIDVSLPQNSKIQDLLNYMREHLLQEREELFYQGKTVRPGILVLVNDTDWECLDNEECELEEGDVISFISTLH